MAKKTELTGQKIRQLIKKVDKEKPAKADIERFEKLLEDTESWRIAGDLVRINKNQLISSVSGKSYLVKRSLDEGYEAIKTGLGYNDVPMLEKLLIEQVAINWLRHHYIEYQYQSLQPQRMSLTQAMYWERKLSQSQRRYLRACETLAKIRKMDIKLQVNVATNQVNVAK